MVVTVQCILRISATCMATYLKQPAPSDLLHQTHYIVPLQFNHLSKTAGSAGLGSWPD